MFVSCRPGALNAEQLRRAYARNSAQRDALILLRFDWYADDVCAMFEGAVE